MKDREHWKSRSTFIMAAVGSAIGLGNLWRFPYVAAQNGGGAFLVPYFIALLTAGIPLMMVEYGLGVRSQSSAYAAFGAIDRRLRFVGWLAILGAFAINIYYCAVLAWACYCLVDSASVATWAADVATSEAHFFGKVLAISKGPWQLGGIRWPLLGGLVIVWATIWFIIKGGLGKVGKVLLFTVPLPVVLILILVVRGLTLPGAEVGLNYYLAPDWTKLADPRVWLAAYGQIFFSLSLGFGTMIVYASFMPRDTEVPNSAAITSFSNCAFSFMAGFAVFSVLGYFAVATNLPVGEVAKDGPTLAFVVYPAALATLPFWVGGFAFLFFVTLLLLGVDSAFSLLETAGTALADKFDLSRTTATSIVTLISLALGIPFVSCAGLYWLDIVDHFLLNYLITFVAVAECIAVGYFLGAKRFAAEVDRRAEIRIGSIFGVMIRFVTPVILAVVLVVSFVEELRKPYEGYPLSAILVLGVGVVVAAFAGSFVLAAVHTRADDEREGAARETFGGNT
jgi:NSS family neurotransmitter:Na+ symporter